MTKTKRVANETPPPWQVLATEAVADCRIFTVERARSRSPRDGGVHNFYRIQSPDWVNVVPLTPDAQVVMVRQHRHGAQALTLEIPGGLVDAGETPAAAGARELREETGYRAARLRPLGALNPNPALFGNRLHTFLAEECSVAGAVQNSSTEETQVVCVPLAEIPARARAGEINHALVIAAFYWLGLAR